MCEFMDGWMDGWMGWMDAVCKWVVSVYDDWLASADWFAVAITSEIRAEERILATFIHVCGDNDM